MYDLPQVDCRKASDGLQRIKSKVWLLMQAEKLEQGDGGAVT